MTRMVENNGTVNREKVCYPIVGRLKDSKSWRALRKSLTWMIPFFFGYFTCVIVSGMKEKLLQVDFALLPQEIVSLIEMYEELGPMHFRPCQEKVADLHQLIIKNSNSDDLVPEAGKLIASILIDGNDCNSSLGQQIYSDENLPFIKLPFAMRNVRQLQVDGEIANTEGELMVWLLERVNPGYRLTSSSIRKAGCSYSDQGIRHYWYSVATEK